MAKRLAEAADEWTRGRLPARESLVRSIKGWEAGRHRPKNPYPTLYARAFGMDKDELFSESVSITKWVSLDLAYDHLRQSLDEVLTVGAMTEASMDQWELTVSLHGEAARSRPASLLLHDLAADFEDLRRTMERHRSASALRGLARVAAQMSGLMCLALIKLDDRAAFRRWARTARTAASEAGDPATDSWVLAQEAYGHYYAGDLYEAVRVAQRAQHITVPCVGAVLAAALEARAHAALGPARAQDVRTALECAEVMLGELAPSEVNNSAFGYNEGQLRFHEGNAYTHLGDTHAAWRAQQRALQLCPDSDYMDLTLTRLDRTICLVREGDVTAALEYATGALAPLTEPQRRGIITLRGRDVLAVLPRRQRAVPATRQLCELLTPTTGGEAEYP